MSSSLLLIDIGKLIMIITLVTESSDRNQLKEFFLSRDLKIRQAQHEDHYEVPAASGAAIEWKGKLTYSTLPHI